MSSPPGNANARQATGRADKQIGIYENLVAFPVDDGSDHVVGTHFRLKNGDWNYAPKGIKAAPLVFGELMPGEHVQIFESTWDGLDYMDKSGERSGIIITPAQEMARGLPI